MNKKKIIIIGIELLILICGAFLVAYLASSQTTPKEFLTEIKENIKENFQNSEEKDNKRYNQALYYANERACEDIKNPGKKQECTDNARIARFLQQPNNADCSIIQNEERYIQCKNLMYEKTALDANNKILCEQIANENIKQRCRENIDANILMEMTKNHSANPENCKKLENNFREECEKLIENYQTEAIYADAIQKENLIACGELNEENLKKQCHDEIIFKKSISENTQTLCTYISDDERKKICIQTTQNQQDNTIFQIATASNNIAICENIKNTDMKDRCHDIIILAIVKQNKTSEPCKNLKNQENTKICEQIPKL